jgi:hypothetical protein
MKRNRKARRFDLSNSDEAQVFILDKTTRRRLLLMQLLRPV